MNGDGNCRCHRWGTRARIWYMLAPCMEGRSVVYLNSTTGPKLFSNQAEMISRGFFRGMSQGPGHGSRHAFLEILRSRWQSRRLPHTCSRRVGGRSRCSVRRRRILSGRERRCGSRVDRGRVAPIVVGVGGDESWFRGPLCLDFLLGPCGLLRDVQPVAGAKDANLGPGEGLEDTVREEVLAFLEVVRPMR